MIPGGDKGVNGGTADTVVMVCTFVGTVGVGVAVEADTVPGVVTDSLVRVMTGGDEGVDGSTADTVVMVCMFVGTVGVGVVVEADTVPGVVADPFVRVMTGVCDCSENCGDGCGVWEERMDEGMTDRGNLF